MIRRSVSTRRELEEYFAEQAREFRRSRWAPHPGPAQPEPVGTGISSAVGSAPSELVDDPVLARLLLWLDTQDPRWSEGFVDLALFVAEQCLHKEDPSVLAFELAQRGLVARASDAHHAIGLRLTDAGRSAVHHLKKRHADRAARLRYTMDAFLRWLFDTAGDQSPTDPSLFLATPSAYFAGAAVSGTDLHQALAYLAEPNLIERIDTDPATVAITPQGVGCALSGGSVQDHINQPSPGDKVTFHIQENTGNIAANSTGFTQNAVTQNEFNPAKILEAVNLLQQLAPALTSDASEQEELRSQVTELRAAATDPAQDRGLVRRIASRVLATVRGLAHSPDVQRLALEAVEQGIQNL